MDPGFESRLARRREQVRRREIRRRRILFGSVGAVLLAAVLALLLTRGDKDPGNREPDAPTATAARQAEAPDQKAPERGGARPDDTWKPYSGPVPILMYHVIGPPAADEAYPDLFLDTEDFRSQVDWLADNGYTAVTLVQVQDAWYDGGKLPPKPVVLSFDDGYLGQYLDAMPILREKGWAGQLNLKSEGSDLSSRQVRKMYRAGWEIASHTITHPDLTRIDAATLEQELVGSKKQLEKDLGIEIENFCYPAGQYNDEVIAAVEKAGYRGATTVNPGLAEKSMPFELNRIRIDRGDTGEDLGRKLAAAGA